MEQAHAPKYHRILVTVLLASCSSYIRSVIALQSPYRIHWIDTRMTRSTQRYSNVLVSSSTNSDVNADVDVNVNVNVNVDVTRNESCECIQVNHVNGMEQIMKDNKNYKSLLLDMWGVMHNGSEAYPGVLDTISKLKEDGIKLVILSNSSKRKSNSIKMLGKLGFNPDDFDDIITSGEIAFQLLSRNLKLSDEHLWSKLENIKEQKVFVFGSGDGDEEYCTSSGWELAPITEANLILARGTFTINGGVNVGVDGENFISADNTIISKNIHGEELYFKELNRILTIAASRQIPMLISNPDKVRPDKGLPPMPGAIGDSYESILCDYDNGPGLSKELSKELVKRIGKPFPEVYDIALKKQDNTPNEVCMIGDALETDITGGTNIGCDTVWIIKDGIHGPAVGSDDKQTQDQYEENVKSVLASFNTEKGFEGNNKLSPTFVAPHFRW